MNKKYASLFLGASMFFLGSTYAQKHSTEFLLQKFNSRLAEKAPEDSLSNLAFLYAKSINSQEIYDSLKNEIIKIYPSGSTAATNDIMALYKKAQSGDLTLAELDQLKAKYPNQQFDNPKKTVGAYYGATVGAAFPGFLEKDSATAVALIPQIPLSSLNQIAWGFAEKGKHLPTAEKISKLSLEKVQAQIADSAKIPEKRRSENVKSMKETYATYEDTYAYILSQLGRKKEALKYQAEAIAATKAEPDMNTRYISLLNANGESKKALAEGSEMYSNNLGNDEMLKQITIAFKKENKGKSADSYISALKTKKEAAAKADIAKSVINKPSPNFTLKNMKGEDVTLTDYKGKIVVLDFWATWCGPCKMSFPGMQLALNKYKNNQNVVFLFIDTWEETAPDATKTAVEKFIADKKYTFNVLYDKKSNEKDFDVATAYTPFGITGIPVKFFIGKDNQVKFMETGYAGSDEKVLQSVVERVDYLLTEKG